LVRRTPGGRLQATLPGFLPSPHGFCRMRHGRARSRRHQVPPSRLLGHVPDRADVAQVGHMPGKGPRVLPAGLGQRALPAPRSCGSGHRQECRGVLPSASPCRDRVAPRPPWSSSEVQPPRRATPSAAGVLDHSQTIQTSPTRSIRRAAGRYLPGGGPLSWPSPSIMPRSLSRA
jgi:hypothetical protein